MFDKETLGLLLGPLGALALSLIINFVQYRKNERLEALLTRMLEDGTTAEVALAYTLKPMVKSLLRTERALVTLGLQEAAASTPRVAFRDSARQQPRSARDLLADDETDDGA